ncbi:N-acetyltransferase [bacterium]|nr:N-acetyltransferase [bacterium]
MIRYAKPSDAAQILDIYAPVIQHTAITFETAIPDSEQFAVRIERITRFYPFLVWEENGVILGYCYATRYRERAAYDWICEAAIYVASSKLRSGIGKKLYDKLFECLRAQGLVYVIGVIRPSEKSVKFHEAMGFKCVGVIPYAGHKFDEWHEAGFWQLVLVDSVPQNPPPVLPFPEVRAKIKLNE